MNWVFVLLVLCVAMLLLAIASYVNCWGRIAANVLVCGIALILVLYLPLRAVQADIRDKYDWYMEISLKYDESEGIEKEYLEITDVMTYNLWYTENKADLENPWNFKSAARCEFDYIKVGD